MVMKRTFLIAVFTLATSLAYAQADDATLLPGAELPLQGACGDQGVVSESKSGSGTISTFACAGSASEMVNLSYSDGSFDRCIYIDNTDVDKKSYFIPVQTIKEWVAFKLATQPGGTLHNKIKIAYGCEAATITDSCDKVQKLPRARAGIGVTLNSVGTKRLTYVCSALNTCGTWTLATNEGTCAINGMCGSANTVPMASSPVANLCSAGIATEVVQGAQQWEWECKGLNGGTDAPCISPIIRNGECGPADGASTATIPLAGLCNVGAAAMTESTFDRYNWICAGENGGENVACGAPRMSGHWVVEKNLTCINVAAQHSEQPCGEAGSVCVPLGSHCIQPTGECDKGLSNAVQMRCQ